MAFAIYLHRDNFQPEEPIILDKNISTDPNVKFTFVDFVPSVIKRSATVIPSSEVQYHSFSQMIETANEWLRRNSEWRAVNCETVILLYKYNDQGNYNELRPNDCCFYIYGSEKNNVLKALRQTISRNNPVIRVARVWVRKRLSTDENKASESQVLSYMDIIPENRDASEYSANKFETLSEVMNRTNAMIRSGGLCGRIITIESISFDANNDWKIDTEVSLSSFSTKTVFILRIFYELGEPTNETIGIMDFAPKMLSRGTFFKRPKFETFDKVIERGSEWLQQNPNFRFSNAQSIDIKMKSLSKVNTNVMAFTEHGDYSRIFRVTYTEPMVASDRPPTPVTLLTRIFLPSKKTDTIHDIKMRISDWVNQYLCLNCDTTRVPLLLSAETVEVFAKDDNLVELEKAALDDTFLANRFGNKNAYMFFTLRIFYEKSLVSSERKNISSESDDSIGNSNDIKAQ